MKKIICSAAVAVAVLGGSVLVAAPALASGGNAGSTSVVSLDVTGAQFTCSDGSTYDVLAGAVRSILHDSFSPSGEHVSGTIEPNGVTLSHSTDSAVYSLAGASWFGGNFNYATQKFEFTDTGFFEIIGPSGGVVAKVASVEHMGTGGASFSFSFGQCQEPSD
jgi:hypothetical protein